MSGHGFHWTPCEPGGGRGGGIPASLLIAALVIGGGGMAVSAAMPVIIKVVEIVAIVIISALGAGVLGVLLMIGLAVRRRLAARRDERDVITVEVIDGEDAPTMPQGPRPAIQGKPLMSATTRPAGSDRERAPQWRRR